MSTIDHIAGLIETAFDGDLPKSEIAQMIEIPPDPRLGDFGFPCFPLARVFRKAPDAIASELAAKIRDQGPSTGDPQEVAVVQVQAVGAYVNFSIDRSALAHQVLAQVLAAPEAYGSSDEGHDKTIVIDFSSPNVAKPFGIGHLRSTVIGNSLYRIHSFLGYPVVRVNHLGDWGTQFGKLIVAYKRWGGDAPLASAPVQFLYDLYVRFHAEADQDPSLEDEAREWHRRIEEGDVEARGLWQAIIDSSVSEFKRIYQLLDVDFDSWAGESFYEDRLEDTLRLAIEKGVAREDDGALIVDLSAWEMPPCLLRKSDGATLYATRDLAAAIYRAQTYGFHKLIYVVGTPQKLHFQQIFKVLELLEFGWTDRCVHVDFGQIRFREGRMQTRKGNIVLLEDVLEQAISLVDEIIGERQFDVEDRRQVAQDVGIGAVIFADLSRRRIKDVIFEWDEILNFDGETGPYLQYTHARLCSILRKYEQPIDLSANGRLLTEPEEFAVIRLLEDFPRTVLRAAEDYEPSLISDYLIRLATAANQFYQKHRVLDSANPDMTRARIMLVDATRAVLKTGLHLLGIRAPEKM